MATEVEEEAEGDVAEVEEVEEAEVAEAEAITMTMRIHQMAKEIKNGTNPR